MTSSTSSCATCGAANRAQARFCSACSSPMLLKQRYRIIELIGQGGFGVVYRAEDTQLGDRQIAIKGMSQHGLSPQEQKEAAEAFEQEAHMLACLQHPHLPSIFDHFEENGRWYLVMSFIQGETLEDYLTSKQEGKLLLDEVITIGTQLCSVLDYLHHQHPPIIFRDLKPSNIMRTSDGHIYLIDFGIARHFKPGQATDTIPFGSPGYAPPEQYGRAQTTTRSDVYSLGATLYQLLSGYDRSSLPKPFDSPSLHLLAPTIPASLATFITQMLEMDEAKRPANVLLVKQALQALAPPPVPNQQSLPPVPNQQSLPPVPQSRPPGPQPNLYSLTLPPSQGTLLVRYTGHAQPVHSVAWSPDGTCIASTSEDKTVQVWSVHSRMRPFTYRGHAHSVFAIAWSLDGTRIASASDREVHIWRADDNGRPFVYDRRSYASVRLVAWSPDGTHIASVSSDKVQVWNVDNNGHSFTYSGHSQLIDAIAWSPDGTRIASASDREVHIWRADNGGQLFIYKGHTKPVHSVAWSPDGVRIASASEDKTVQVWHADGRGQPSIYKGRSDEVTSVAWSPDGTRIVFTTDGTVLMWNADGRGQPYIVYQGISYVQGFIYKRRSYAALRSVAWSPDGARIAFIAEYEGIQVWHAGGRPFVYKGHADRVLSIVWSPDSTRIASVSASDSRVHVWSVDGSRQPFIHDSLSPAYFPSTAAVAWSPDGTRIASASGSAVHVWNTDGSEQPVVYHDPSYTPGLVAWSSDGKRIAFGSGNTVQVWNAGGCQLFTYKGHAGAVEAVAWSPDGTRIASASDNTVHVWQADGRVKPFISKGHANQVLTIVWSPDGMRIASASMEKNVRVWNVDGSGRPFIYKGHGGGVGAVAWSPDGTRIASASDNTVHVWQADGRGRAFIYKGHTDVVFLVAWSPDGMRIVSASRAKEDAVHVWNVDDRGKPFIYTGHNYYMWGVLVTTVAWSPDSMRIASIASGSADAPDYSNKAVHVWNADGSGQPFIYKGHSNAVLSVAWSPDGKYIASASQDSSVQVWSAG